MEIKFSERIDILRLNHYTEFVQFHRKVLSVCLGGEVQPEKGNQVKILSDPVTVSRERTLRNIHCTASLYEKDGESALICEPGNLLNT